MRSVIDLSTGVVSHTSVVFKRNRFDKKQEFFYQLTLLLQLVITYAKTIT